MECRCAALDELTGVEAQNYEREHLVEVDVAVDQWQTVLKCPRQELFFLMDYPQSEFHGGGPPRLRPLWVTIANASPVVEADAAFEDWAGRHGVSRESLGDDLTIDTGRAGGGRDFRRYRVKVTRLDTLQ